MCFLIDQKLEFLLQEFRLQESYTLHLKKRLLQAISEKRSLVRADDG
jgi:hypothetical protein